MRWLILLLLVSTWPCVGRAQSTLPATAPVVQGEEQLFLDDTMKFNVPPGWTVTAVSEDTRTVLLLNEAKDAVLKIVVDPQTASMTQNADTKRLMGEAIVKGLRDRLEAEKTEMIEPPKLKRDEAFFIRIEDKYRDHDRVADRLHVFRVLGINLLRVVAVDLSGNPEQTAAVHTLGEQLVYQIRTNKLPRPTGVPTGQKPSLFRKAKVKLTPAKGWLEEKKDADGGVIATYREPLPAGVVTVRVLSMAAQQRPRDEVVAKMSRDDLASMPVPDATQGEVESATDGRFASKSMQKYTRKGLTFRVENRVMIVGEMLLSVTSSSTELKSVEVGKFADELAATAEVFTPR